MLHMVDLNNLDCKNVKYLLKHLDINKTGKEYLAYLNTMDEPSEEFKKQVMYVLANARAKDDALKRVVEVLKKWADDGEHSYCKICGTRKADRFGQYGKKICDTCYKIIGEDRVCIKCGDKTYEGEYLACIDENGEDSGSDNFICNWCLDKV